MPRKKETIGRRYGVALAKEYFGRNTHNEDLRKSGERAKKRLNKLIEEDPEALTEEDGEEISAYISAIDVYEAERMAALAYVFQAIAYANRAARFIQQVADAERAHTYMCVRPLLVFIDTEKEEPVDAEGNSVHTITLTDLSTVDPEEDPEGFIADMKSNDIVGRLGLIGKSALMEKDDPETRDRLQRADRGLPEDYEGLFELKRDLLKEEIANARRVIETSTYFIDRHIFTAQLLETFLKIEGVSDFIIHTGTIDTVRRTAVEAFNHAISLFDHDFVFRYSISPDSTNMAEEGRRYVDRMLSEARAEWLYPTEWLDRSEDLKKAGKAAAKELTYSTLGSTAALESFVNLQMTKRGLH